MCLPKGGWGSGDFHIYRRWWFWYLQGCSASKGPRLELFRYHLGYYVGKKHNRGLCVVLESAPLRDDKHFKPRPRNSILVPRRSSFKNFLQAFPSSLCGNPPGIETAFALTIIAQSKYRNTRDDEIRYSPHLSARQFIDFVRRDYVLITIGK